MELGVLFPLMGRQKHVGLGQTGGGPRMIHECFEYRSELVLRTILRHPLRISVKSISILRAGWQRCSPTELCKYDGISFMHPKHLNHFTCECSIAFP